MLPWICFDRFSRTHFEKRGASADSHAKDDALARNTSTAPAGREVHRQLQDQSCEAARVTTGQRDGTLCPSCSKKNHRETCEPNVRAWMDGASSFDEDGAETAPGASAWVQARPFGPRVSSMTPIFKIAARLRLMVHLCAHETRCACAATSTGAMCGTSMEPLAHHALLCSRAQMSWRHDVVAETWQAICRDAGLSAHLKQKAAEFPPGDFRRISDVYCRGVAGDLPVHLDVVVTSSIHNHAHEWHIANVGVAVAREERRNLREWGYDEILGCTARLVPLAFESQGRWGQSAINELERLARLKGGLLAGSPHEAANVAAASLARWRHWLSGYGA